MLNVDGRDKPGHDGSKNAARAVPLLMVRRREQIRMKRMITRDVVPANAGTHNHRALS
jgi:hypothetical protein